MQRVKFNYEYWKNHPDRSRLEFTTTEGEVVKNLTDSFDIYPYAVAGQIGIELHTWTEDGYFKHDNENYVGGKNNLWMRETPVDRYMNVYRNPSLHVETPSIIYSSMEEAVSRIKFGIYKDLIHVGTFKLIEP